MKTNTPSTSERAKTREAGRPAPVSTSGSPLPPGTGELRPDQLIRPCDPSQLGFALTSELPAQTGIIGQARAVEAIRLAAGMAMPGFNLFALGPPGTGKRSIVLQVLREQAQAETVPDGWCYVSRFDDDERPQVLRLPPGRATALKEDVDAVLEDLLAALPAAFETVEYTTRRSDLQARLDARSRDAYENVRAEAAHRGLVMVNGSDGVEFVPSDDGRPREDGFNGLPDPERSEMEALAGELRTEVDLAARSSREAVREIRQAMDALTKQTVSGDLAERLEGLRTRFADLSEVTGLVDAMEADILEHLDLFLPEEDVETSLAPFPSQADAEMWRLERKRRLDRYRVNVLVDHLDDSAPVLYEAHPSLGNLMGRIEHRQTWGTLSTDFTMVRPGALHRANGGFLVMEAADVLKESGSWEALKRCLRTREIRIGASEDAPAPFAAATLTPDPVPLNVKVALVGDLETFHAMYEVDPELGELFKIQAEFGDTVERTPDSERAFGRFVAGLAAAEGLRAFTAGAVGALVDYAARAADDSRRLSIRFSEIADVVREAHYWAGQAGADVVERQAVETALAARIRRLDLTQENIADAFLRDVVLLATDGTAVGQVNGVTVFSVGEVDFGVPVRITARVHQGAGEVVDIEREVELGGPLHSKGVLILGGYIAGRYVPDDALAMAATLTFEQSAAHIDGDSASAGELCALLSAIARVPLRQGIAVTGSVNQAGEIQAVGAVNQKVEGFFDICAARGLTGTQGVILPAANVQHLMLRADVVEAVREGRFHIYAVRTVDDSLEILTGLPAGERSALGDYPKDSVNRRIEERLRRLAAHRNSGGADPGE